jgi:hypothetical protein
MGGARDARAVLEAAQDGLRSRFDDFKRAFDRRDRAAYTLALADFHDWLCRWTEAEQRALLPALRRAELPGRDAQRELTLEYVQLRELTRFLRTQVEGSEAFSLADALGLTENLSRRLEAHERQNREVYYPAAAKALDEEEARQLEEAARGC